MIDIEYFLTNQNIKMPKLIYGTAWKKENTTKFVINAIKLGFKGIDTACQPKHYNEKLVGDALIELKKQGIERENLFLQTKFTPIRGQDPNNTPYDKKASLEEQVYQSFQVSKKNLQTNYIDSLVLHSPMDSNLLTQKVWSVFEKIYEEKGIKQLGISNCYDLEVLEYLYKNSKIKPSVIQNRFYKETNFDKEIRAFCLKNNIIYQSFWTLTANPQLLDSNEIKTLAKKYNKTSAQILFRYLTQNNVAPLTGTCTEKHMLEDLQIFTFELDVKDLEQITKLI
ncbi:MAG: aldo/keto reductase [Candidatus Sericytochromatia bacterium]